MKKLPLFVSLCLAGTLCALPAFSWAEDAPQTGAAQGNAQQLDADEGNNAQNGAANPNAAGNAATGENQAVENASENGATSGAAANGAQQNDALSNNENAGQSDALAPAEPAAEAASDASGDEGAPAADAATPHPLLLGTELVPGKKYAVDVTGEAAKLVEAPDATENYLSYEVADGKNILTVHGAVSIVAESIFDANGSALVIKSDESASLTLEATKESALPASIDVDMQGKLIIKSAAPLAPAGLSAGDIDIDCGVGLVFSHTGTVTINTPGNLKVRGGKICRYININAHDVWIRGNTSGTMATKFTINSTKGNVDLSNEFPFTWNRIAGDIDVTGADKLLLTGGTKATKWITTHLTFGLAATDCNVVECIVYNSPGGSPITDGDGYCRLTRCNWVRMVGNNPWLFRVTDPLVQDCGRVEFVNNCYPSVIIWYTQPTYFYKEGQYPGNTPFIGYVNQGTSAAFYVPSGAKYAWGGDVGKLGSLGDSEGIPLPDVATGYFCKDTNGSALIEPTGATEPDAAKHRLTLLGNHAFDDIVYNAPAGVEFKVGSGAKLVNSGGLFNLSECASVANEGTIVNDGELRVPSGTTPAQIKALRLQGSGIVEAIHPDDELTGKKYFNDGSKWTPNGPANPVYIVEPSVSEGGTISPDGVQGMFEEGDTLTYTYAPNEGYYVADVLIDGVSVGVPKENSHTFTFDALDHTIHVEFKKIAPAGDDPAKGNGTSGAATNGSAKHQASGAFAKTADQGMAFAGMAACVATLTVAGAAAVRIARRRDR